MTRYIQRHSLLTRVTHGVAAVACILLAVTGVFVFVPSLGGGIMGGEFTQTCACSIASSRFRSSSFRSSPC